jgi:hypothetical protein
MLHSKKLQVLFVSCSFIFSHAHVSYFKVMAKSITTFLDSLYSQVLKIAESIAKAHAGTTISAMMNLTASTLIPYVANYLHF